MSIVLPVDPPEPGENRKNARRSERHRPLFTRVREIPLWRIFTSDLTRNVTSNRQGRPGNLRLVTSRWVDKPKKQDQSEK